MSKFSALLAVALLGSGCGPSTRTNGTGADGGNGDGDGGSTQVDGGNCGGSTVTAKQVPLDLFVMLDKSSSMTDAVTGGTKWTTVTAALNAFLGQAGLTDVSVGLQYFGLPPSSANSCTVFTCMKDADCGPAACGGCLGASAGNPGVCLGALTSAGGDSCTASDYAQAAVEIAPLSTSGPAIASSIAATQPTTSTPTSAALQGAIDHAKAWAAAHTSDAVAVILATDGDPTECDTDLTHINGIAAAGFSGTPKIPTFVIGVGSSLSALNGIAAAGGTTSAFLVDTGGNVNAQFLAAMNQIRHAALGCQYLIPLPQSGVPNFQQVNVNYVPGNGASVTFPYVTSAAACPANGNAWYYDNAAAPTQIILCPSTCTTVEGDSQATVNITLGCNTVIS
jgi:hypothetical protein